MLAPLALSRSACGSLRRPRAIRQCATSCGLSIRPLHMISLAYLLSERMSGEEGCRRRLQHRLFVCWSRAACDRPRSTRLCATEQIPFTPRREWALQHAERHPNICPIADARRQPGAGGTHPRRVMPASFVHEMLSTHPVLHAHLRQLTGGGTVPLDTGMNFGLGLWSMQAWTSLDIASGSPLTEVWAP